MGSHRQCRLPFRFDPERLQRDLRSALRAEWVPHFVTSNYEGEWSAIALRSADGELGHAYSKPELPAAAYRDTWVMQSCAYFGEVLARLECCVGSVRLLRLGAGSVIKEHTDNDLGYDGGTVRLHVPIATLPEVEFHVEDERVVMQTGECWYVDTSLPHRVANRSPKDRIHLVFDCELNSWLRERLEQAGLEERPKDPSERRGVRRVDEEKVLEQLRAMGTAVGECLAQELAAERERRLGQGGV
jgi:hypothetical protein